MDLIVSEIRTFNKGLEPIGRPYWITSKENRSSGLYSIGIIVVAFPTEEQAKRAIQNKLLIAGFSAKVAKYIAIPNTAQCNKYAGFGYLESFCKRDLKYILYSENHNIKQYLCSIYKKRGEKYQYLVPKYANYNSIIYSANNKLYKVFIIISNKITSPIIINK
jgi:hypothetical protein